MKQRIAPGAEIEALTPLEAEALIAEMLGAGGRPQVTVRGDASGQTSAGGVFPGEGLVVYRVPQGMAFKLTRLYVRNDGNTFGNPFTGAGAALLLQRNDVEVDGAPLFPGSGGSLPAVLTDSETQANHFVNGEAVVVQFIAGPASQNVVVRFQGELLAAVAESELDDDKPKRNGRR